MSKCTIRLDVKAIENAQKEKSFDSDTQLAAAIGVSVTQVWRAKLPICDPRHNSPGPTFIAGVLNAFGGPFEKFFFLDTVMRERIDNVGSA